MSESYRGTIKVRFADTDANGHAFFANYLVFADEVLGEYWGVLGEGVMGRILRFGFDMLSPELASGHSNMCICIKIAFRIHLDTSQGLRPS